jgi:hypothetical protein
MRRRRRRRRRRERVRNLHVLPSVLTGFILPVSYVLVNVALFSSYDEKSSNRSPLTSGSIMPHNIPLTMRTIS